MKKSRVLGVMTRGTDLPTSVFPSGSGLPRPTLDGRPVPEGDFGTQYLAEFAPLLSLSPKMSAVKKIIEDVAGTSATILIRGESGVGKDLVARAIHAVSSRRDRPFVKVNCAALPAELLESELFGHEKGAFTGAYRRKLGKFEFASQGTICLDEIGEMPRALQAKLLHVLQDLQFSRIGGRELIHVDARVIATTNRDLEAAIASGDFREDLYYRLNVVEIRVPPLREWREAIPKLVSYHVRRCNQQYGRNVSIPPETLKVFMEYSWPGNVRELENAVRRLVVLGDARTVHDELVGRLRNASAKAAELPGAGQPPAAQEPGDTLGLGLKAIARQAARDAERKALIEVLERVRWNRAEAARLLKVSYKTLLSKLTECGIASSRSKRPRE